MDAQREQSATMRCTMSSGRSSGENILASVAKISLGRRQSTPASFCSGDNSSSPSGSLKRNERLSVVKGKSEHTYLNGTSSAVLEEEVLAVQSRASTRLTMDPFFNTSCCSSVQKEYTSCGYWRTSEPKQTNPEQMDRARPVPSRAWRPRFAPHVSRHGQHLCGLAPVSKDVRPHDGL